MNTDFIWEDVVPIRASNPKLSMSISCHKDAKGTFNYAVIARDAAQKAGLDVGDRVILRKAQGLELYMLVKVQPYCVDAFTIRATSTGPNAALKITGEPFCMSIHAKKNKGAYDAFISNGNLVFKPKDSDVELNA